MSPLVPSGSQTGNLLRGSYSEMMVGQSREGPRDFCAGEPSFRVWKQQLRQATDRALRQESKELALEHRSWKTLNPNFPTHETGALRHALTVGGNGDDSLAINRWGKKSVPAGKD